MVISASTVLVAAPGSSTAYGSGSSSTSDTSSTDAPAGSTLFVFLDINTTTGATVTSVTDSNSNVYTLAQIPSPTFWGICIAATQLTSQLNSGSDWKVLLGGGEGQYLVVGACYFTGLTNASVDKTNYVQNGSGNSLTVSTGTLSQPTELILAFMGGGGSFAGYIRPAGFSIVGESPTNKVIIDYNIVSSTASVTYNPSWTSSNTNWAVIASYEGVPPPPYSYTAYVI